jgi:hypothetical protein
MPLSSNFRLLLIAIIAWPAGFLAAIGVLVFKGVTSGCRGGGPCALEQTSWMNVLLWLAIAVGPGIVATHHWWTHRKPRPDGES